MDRPVRRIPTLWRGLCLAHGAAVVAWWMLLPGGFPLSHPRFWAHQVLPWVLLAISLGAAFSPRRRNLDAAVGFVLPALWLGLPLVGLAVFPQSALRLVLPGLAPGGVLLGAWLARFRCRPSVTAGLIGIALAVALVVPQRGPDPDTLPAGPLPRHPPGVPSASPEEVALEPAVVFPNSGRVQVTLGTLEVSLEPLLLFFDATPDRCWTIFCPSSDRRVSHFELAKAEEFVGGLALSYHGDADRGLGVFVTPFDGIVALEAWTRLEEPVYSHLNSFCTLTIRGHRRLTLGFSPCADARIEPVPSDYPAGRPRRAACLLPDGTFRVVEATSAEKGPFATLAEGRLVNELTITLYDEDVLQGRIVMMDWARQAGRQLSPTAGWGMPVNAIELERETERPDAPCTVFFTLAGTSLGRGWDAVGHREGVTINRIMLSPAVR